MKAVRLSCGRRIPPFLDPMSQVQVAGRDLESVQREELAAAGFEPVSEPPADEPYLLYSDRTWFTREALVRFREQAQPPARLRVDHSTWLEACGPLQRWDEPGLYELALLPAGADPDFGQAPPVTVDLGFVDNPTPAPHPALVHATPESVPASDAAVFQIDHWVHILRANVVAKTAMIERSKRKFERSNPFSKALAVLKLVTRMRSLSEAGVRAALSRFGSGCKVHPTAVVEASVIGADVSIGPFAVVRAATIGKGVTIDEHASVNFSVVGEGANVSRRATLNLCVAYPGAHVAAGEGFQACVFGRDAFVAWSSTVFDLSFHQPIKVWDEGERVSSGEYFLGAAIGHRARIGGKVVLGYGAEVPNDGFVVGSADAVLRGWEDGPSPHRVVDGVARPIRRDDSAEESS